MSDGSMRGTVMKPQQFSGFWYRSLDGHEGSVSQEEADRRAMAKLAEARGSRAWPEIVDTADRLMAGKYEGGPEFMKLKDAVNFYAPKGVDRPGWATPDRFVTRIGGHDFYTR